MVYKNFRFNIVLRIAFLILSIGALFYFITNFDIIITPILVGVFIFIQIFSLINYVDKTNRDLSSFFESIRF